MSAPISAVAKRPDAPALPGATNRRAVLGAVLAAGATAAAALPPVAEPALGTDHQGYQRALDLWNRWREQNDRYDALASKDPSDEELGKELDVLDEIEDTLCGDMWGSVHALALSLMIEMGHGGLEERVVDIHLAALAAIRPQLVGAIAEDADRVLAQVEEEGA